MLWNKHSIFFSKEFLIHSFCTGQVKPDRMMLVLQNGVTVQYFCVIEIENQRDT